MQDAIKQAEEKITHIIRSGFGERRRLAARLADIREIPLDDYSELVSKCSSGEWTLRLAPRSTSSSLFRLIAPEGDRNRFTFYALAALAAPPLAIVLAIMYSAWFLFLVFCVPVFIKILRIHYRKVVLDMALKSEIVFCYLFSNKYIAIEADEGKILQSHNLI